MSTENQCQCKSTLKPDNNRPKVLITSTSIPQKGLELLSSKCDLVTVSMNDRSEIIKRASGVDAIFWATRDHLDKDILDSAGPSLKVVSIMRGGFDNVDMEECKKRNIPLGFAPQSSNNPVADVAVLLCLAAARRLHESRLKIEQGKWEQDFNWMLGKDFDGSTVGLFGLGGIGIAIAKRLKAFEVARILYSCRNKKAQADELGAKFVPLDELIKESDFIIVAVPLTNETEGICNEEFFKKMKPSAIFVNISRGKVVDQKALVQALKNGEIFAAGLDVMTPEPLPVDDEILTLPNCVLMPHLGCATERTRNEMAYITALNIIKGLNGEPLAHSAY